MKLRIFAIAGLAVGLTGCTAAPVDTTCDDTVSVAEELASALGVAIQVADREAVRESIDRIADAGKDLNELASGATDDAVAKALAASAKHAGEYAKDVRGILNGSRTTPASTSDLAFSFHDLEAACS